MRKDTIPVRQDYQLVPAAIDALLRKTCRQCSKELRLHAVGLVATRSPKSWTSSATTALELYCPTIGNMYQTTLPSQELRMRIVMKLMT